MDNKERRIWKIFMQCQGKLSRNKVKQKDKIERVNTLTVYLVLWIVSTVLEQSKTNPVGKIKETTLLLLVQIFRLTLLYEILTL